MDTIFVLNSNKQVIDVLSNNGSNPSAPFFDDTYKSELDTGAESYEFTTINNARTNITLEVGNYVLFKYNGKYKLFQIMETTDEHSEGKKLLTCYCEMAGMELRNDYCEPFSIEGNFITFLNTILQDTNWQVGLYSESLLNNIQNISYTEPKNVYSLIQENLSIFGGVEIEFRVEFVNNQLAALLIDCYAPETRGKRTYRRFEYGEDVKGITRERNINDLATAVIGIGKNNIDFKEVEWNKTLGDPCDKPLQQNFVVDTDANDLWNNGGKYIKAVYKSDTDDPGTLLQEAWDYLQEVKQPKFDYDVDLALVAEDYLDINVGDTNYVVDFAYNPPILLEARVGVLELSFANARDNKCTLTNYKELVSILTQPVDLNTVGNMISSHFPIQGVDIAMGAIGEGHIDVTYYKAIKTDFLQASLAEVGTLIADKADISDLAAINADILNLTATKADITDLTVTNGNINNLTAQVGNIENLLAGNAVTGDLQSMHITASNATIDNGVIKNAMIDNITADKISAGSINTNNVTIESEDGGIKITGATQQFKDESGNIRVQIGKDAQGNFTFCLFSQDGVGILLDEEGIKAGAVPDGLIVDDMVASDANISGDKIDISSVITNINNNTTSINSSSIKFDDTGQSLLVAFNSLKNQVDTIQEVTIGGDLSSIIEKVNTHTTQIGVMQGQISSLIENTTITKQDGTVVQLKDEYNNTVSTVNSNTTKIGTLESNYNKVTGDLESVTSRTTTIESNLNGVTTRVSQAETDLTNTKTTVAEHSTTLEGIGSRLTSVESSRDDLTTRVTNVENGITKEAIISKISDEFASTDTVSGINTRLQTAENKLTKDGITNMVGDYYADGEITRDAISRIEQKADSVTTSVTRLQGAGSRNLLLNTDYSLEYKYWKYSPAYTWIDSSYPTPYGNTSMTLNVSGQTKNMFIGASQNVLNDLVIGDKYTLTFSYKLYEALPPDVGFGIEVKGNDAGIEKSIISQIQRGGFVYDKWLSGEITFEVPAYSDIFVYIYLIRNGRITFGDFKLVKGTTTMGWTPAPEDNLDASKSYADSKITQTADSIKSEVSAQYYNKATIDNKVTAIDSSITAIDQKADSISATVSAKVGNDEIISKINMSPENISIQADKIDMTGAVDLHGTFTCYADEGNHDGNKLVQSGAIVRGYLAGYNYPIFSSGIWNPTQTVGEDMGYVSVGWGNSDHVDQYGCLYMSPIVLGGGQLVYSKLDDNNNPIKSGINFKKDGSVEYMSFHPEKTTTGATSHSFDGGVDCLTLKARDAIINGSLYVNATVYTDQDSLYLVPGGYYNQYYLSLQKTGYLIPFGSGGIQLGDAVNPFTTLYCTNAPVVMSDEKKKKDIVYLKRNSDSSDMSLRPNTPTNNESLTNDDMYNFVRDDLKLASYKLKDSNKDKKDKTELGFIAQDIKDTKVGKYIVDDNGDNLMYDMGNRISVLEGALQKAIEKIEQLENIINELTNNEAL